MSTSWRCPDALCGKKAQSPELHSPSVCDHLLRLQQIDPRAAPFPQPLRRLQAADELTWESDGENGNLLPLPGLRWTGPKRWVFARYSRHLLPGPAGGFDTRNRGRMWHVGLPLHRRSSILALPTSATEKPNFPGVQDSPRDLPADRARPVAVARGHPVTALHARCADRCNRARSSRRRRAMPAHGPHIGPGPSGRQQLPPRWSRIHDTPSLPQTRTPPSCSAEMPLSLPGMYPGSH
mmetsp:Transcript_93803/g.222992  ORF Transcript_93803/g.222992 Transcript_93803/m.222992 type:complete len:237 (+) Transcript_93803:471-1181(+)